MRPLNFLLRSDATSSMTSSSGLDHSSVVIQSLPWYRAFDGHRACNGSLLNTRGVHEVNVARVGNGFEQKLEFGRRAFPGIGKAGVHHIRLAGDGGVDCGRPVDVEAVGTGVF